MKKPVYRAIPKLLKIEYTPLGYKAASMFFTRFMSATTLHLHHPGVGVVRHVIYSVNVVQAGKIVYVTKVRPGNPLNARLTIVVVLGSGRKINRRAAHQFRVDNFINDLFRVHDDRHRTSASTKRNTRRTDERTPHRRVPIAMRHRYQILYQQIFPSARKRSSQFHPLNRSRPQVTIRKFMAFLPIPILSSKNRDRS